MSYDERFVTCTRMHLTSVYGVRGHFQFRVQFVQSSIHRKNSIEIGIKFNFYSFLKQTKPEKVTPLK